MGQVLKDKLANVRVNRDAPDQLEKAKTRLKEVDSATKVSLQKTVVVEKAFDAVAKKRKTLFNACYNHIYNTVDTIYKEITGSEGGRAFLDIDNADEPFNSGVTYNTMP